MASTAARPKGRARRDARIEIRLRHKSLRRSSIDHPLNASHHPIQDGERLASSGPVDGPDPAPHRYLRRPVGIYGVSGPDPEGRDEAGFGHDGRANTTTPFVVRPSRRAADPAAAGRVHEPGDADTVLATRPTAQSTARTHSLGHGLGPRNAYPGRHRGATCRQDIHRSRWRICGAAGQCAMESG